ncbi:elongation of very long chain fatty acids protein 7-like isoform X2 [Pseudomyrmex gracilis]|uniref:elongation of very long chain fatty acids protein 7-like isoform X2 n=1 Tax=Pseudomyrmex gracilis TaxID=219809 RepID=UPI000995D418|nr:elongation of very long chain fatty acids protein 7-like isoform X2 [Pseudomyrmex gracilis]
MGTLIQQILSWYKYINEDLADPRTSDYYLIGSPWPGLGLLGFYLYFVYSFGPRFMKNRQPFNLDRILQIYDLLQIILNTCVFYQGSVKGWLTTYKFVCEPVDYSRTPDAFEILDLLDTVFFVLRKKTNQVTFLHVYHHVGMVILSWASVKYFPGGHGTFIGWINMFVHIIMYTHYLLASMKINTSSWKRHITHIQLTQFVLILFQNILLLWKKNCDYPVFIAYLLIPQNFFIILLFAEFYYKTYIKKQSDVSIKTKINDISTGKNRKLKKQ